MSARLEVRGLNLRSPELHLGPLDFTLGEGEALLVFGPARAGKSPLLKALAGLTNASGLVRLGEVEVELSAARDLQALQRQVGMVFQNDALFDALTVRENIALPLRRRGTPDADIRITSALSQVDLGSAADKLPEALSGGMRKRAGLARALVTAPRLLLVDEPLAGLARALVTAPRLLLVDEPLAGLDPRNQARVVALLQAALAAGATMVVAVADPAPLWDVCVQALALDRGNIVAHGPRELVRARSRALLGLA